MRRRDVLRALGAASAGAAIGGAAIASRARAWPVRTGRFEELPYGLDPAHPEPMEHGGASRAGRLIAPLPEHEPQIVWQLAIDPTSRTRPREPIVASDGTIVVGTQRGLAALGADGEVRFAELELGPVERSPALLPGDGVVAITRGGRACVVSRGGRVRADVELGFAPSAGPLVLDDGSIVVGASDRVVRRLDASLEERWRVEVGRGLAEAPTRDGDRIAIVAGDELAWLTMDGAIERTMRLGGRGHASAARADDGTLWVPIVDGELVAIEERRRVRARVALARMGTYERIAVAHDGSVRVPARRDGLVCIGPGGDTRWVVPSEHAVDFPARVDPRGWTLIADRAPRLGAIDERGNVVWRARLPTHVWSGAVITASGTIVCVGMRGEVIALR